MPSLARLERQNLLVQLDKAEREVARLRAEIAKIERNCRPHIWGEAIYDPIHHPGYHDPGDPSGTMGVDRQLPCDVPARIEKRWTRTCKNCGYIEETTHARQESVDKPVFPGGR